MSRRPTRIAVVAKEKKAIMTLIFRVSLMIRLILWRCAYYRIYVCRRIKITQANNSQILKSILIFL